MTKRPSRAAVAAAIQAAGGNLSKAAVSIGCSRASLYTWIWQLGLQQMAGLDTHRCPGGHGGKSPEHFDVSVNPSVWSEPTLHGVMSAITAETDLRLPHNIRVRDSVWNRLAHRAVDEKLSLSEAVEQALIQWLGLHEKKGDQ